MLLWCASVHRTCKHTWNEHCIHKHLRERRKKTEAFPVRFVCDWSHFKWVNRFRLTSKLVFLLHGFCCCHHNRANIRAIDQLSQIIRLHNAVSTCFHLFIADLWSSRRVFVCAHHNFFCGTISDCSGNCECKEFAIQNWVLNLALKSRSKFHCTSYH